jgi:hypothetical protein
MEQSQEVAEDTNDRSKKIGLGLAIASWAIGLIWVLATILFFAGSLTGVLEIPEWFKGDVFMISGFASSLVGLGLGIAGNVLTRRLIALSLVGVATNSMVIGFVGLFLLMMLTLS